MRPVFSKSWPTACTYRSEPHLRRLAYDTTPFGPLVVQELLKKVSCVLVHARCSATHKTGAYTLSFFETRIRGKIVQPHLSRFGLSNYNYQRVDSPNRPTQREQCTNCRLFVWPLHSIHCQPAKGQTGEATKEDSASNADDQQTHPSVTAKGQAPGMSMYFCLLLP